MCRKYARSLLHPEVSPQPLPTRFTPPASLTVDAHLPKLHVVGRERARLVGEEVCDLAELVVEVHDADAKRVAPRLAARALQLLLVDVHALEVEVHEELLRRARQLHRHVERERHDVRNYEEKREEPLGGVGARRWVEHQIPRVVGLSDAVKVVAQRAADAQREKEADEVYDVDVDLALDGRLLGRLGLLLDAHLRLVARVDDEAVDVLDVAKDAATQKHVVCVKDDADVGSGGGTAGGTCSCWLVQRRRGSRLWQWRLQVLQLWRILRRRSLQPRVQVQGAVEHAEVLVGLFAHEAGAEDGAVRIRLEVLQTRGKSGGQ